MDKTITVTFTVTPEEHDLLASVFDLTADVGDVMRNLFIMRATSEIRHKIERAKMARRIRDERHHMEHKRAVSIPLKPAMKRD